MEEADLARAAAQKAKVARKARDAFETTKVKRRFSSQAADAISYCAECYFSRPERAIFKGKVPIDTVFRCARYIRKANWINIDRDPEVAKEAITWLKTQHSPADDCWVFFYKSLNKTHRPRALLLLFGKSPGSRWLLTANQQQ